MNHCIVLTLNAKGFDERSKKKNLNAVVSFQTSTWIFFECKNHYTNSILFSEEYLVRQKYKLYFVIVRHTLCVIGDTPIRFVKIRHDTFYIKNKTFILRVSIYEDEIIK